VISPETIAKIIEYAVYAPSGDNSQPWRFEIEESAGKINIFNIPGKDNPILNIRQRGSYIAHGALVENMLIAASQMGFSADLKFFPQGLSDLIATVRLAPSKPKNEPLFIFIKERTTNRKPYKNMLLSEAEKEVLIAAGAAAGCELKLIEDKKMMKIVADAMSATERVALETKELHELFFKNIIWDSARNEAGDSGLYIKTLELPEPIQLIFKIIKFWPVMKFFNTFGFNKLAAGGNSKIYASAAAHGAIIIGNKDENFAQAGRAFQRIWLEATRLGLAFQPVVGTIFLAQRVETKNSHPFSQKNSEFIRQAAQKMELVFGINSGEIAAMIFRIGRADQPGARSKRRPPEIIFRAGS
jgi:nitroreductase